jgi:YHS domain-containing protein
MRMETREVPAPLLTEIDPVCGMEVDPRRAQSATHDEEVFYFCSDRCRTKFVLEPDRYCVSCLEVQ